MTDIVEVLKGKSGWECSANKAEEMVCVGGMCKCEYQIKKAAADEIERLRAELLEAHRYAGQLAVSLRRKHFSELPPFELQPDLYGRLTQIDNMTCGMARAALEEKE